MKTICFVNQKGGVGKTTSCLNIGAALHRAGKRVLLIDLDAQGNLTKSAGILELPDSSRTVSSVLTGKTPAADAVICREGHPDLLPSDIRLSGAEVELLGSAGRDFILKEAIETLKDSHDYDYVLIDCSPSLSILTLMALTASDGLIIPVSAQYMPLDGIVQLMQTVDIVRRRMNPALKIIGVIITLFDSRRSLDKSIADVIQKQFGDAVFSDYVRYNAKVAEAPSRGEDIFTYAPQSSGAKAYKAITAEIIRREEQ